MNYLDRILGICLLWGAIKGFKNGLIIETASLVALFLGIYGALRFSFYTSDLLANKFHMTTRYLNLISLTITFVAIVIFVHLLAKALDKLIKAIALGFINRLTGVLFGITKVAFILSLLLLLVNAIDRKTHFLPQEKVQESFLYKPISGLAPTLFMYLHLDIRQPLQNNQPKKKPPIVI